MHLTLIVEAEHAVIGLPEAAVVNVHLIGCAAYHLTLPHQGLIGQQLRPHPSVSEDGQRLLFREVHLSHLETENKDASEHRGHTLWNADSLRLKVKT